MLQLIPTFPANKLGLQRGSILEVTAVLKEKWPLMASVSCIPIGFDGEHVVSCGLAWSIEQLVHEIEQLGYWKIRGEVIDLSDSSRSLAFAREIEKIHLS